MIAVFFIKQRESGQISKLIVEVVFELLLVGAIIGDRGRRRLQHGLGRIGPARIVNMMVAVAPKFPKDGFGCSTTPPSREAV